MKIIRSTIHGFLLEARRWPLIRRGALRFLVWLHNWSYHLISFFASHSGVHPKHDIMQYHRFFLEHIKPTDSVLDVGSGSGKVAFEVSAKARQVTGIDIRQRNVEHAQRTYRRDNLSFTHGDATAETFTESFDVIILSNVLEHIEQRVPFLRALSAVAPTILVRVPQLNRDWVTVYKKEAGFEYRLDDTHYIEYTVEDLRAEAQEANVLVKHVHSDFGELYAVLQRPV